MEREKPNRAAPDHDHLVASRHRVPVEHGDRGRQRLRKHGELDGKSVGNRDHAVAGHGDALREGAGPVKAKKRAMRAQVRTAGHAQRAGPAAHQREDHHQPIVAVEVTDGLMTEHERWDATPAFATEGV